MRLTLNGQWSGKLLPERIDGMAAPRITIDQLPEQTVADPADLFVVQDGTITKKMTVGRVLDDAAADLNTHVTNPIGAHAGTTISVAPNVAPMTGSDVATQLGQAANAINANTSLITNNTTAISDHVNDVSDAHDASAISLAPVVGMTATDVQAAIVELKVLIDALTP
jgi:hypothetical protein